MVLPHHPRTCDRRKRVASLKRYPLFHFVQFWRELPNSPCLVHGIRRHGLRSEVIAPSRKICYFWVFVFQAAQSSPICHVHGFQSWVAKIKNSFVECFRKKGFCIKEHLRKFLLSFFPFILCFRFLPLSHTSTYTFAQKFTPFNAFSGRTDTDFKITILKGCLGGSVD